VSEALEARITQGLARGVAPQVKALGEMLALRSGAVAVLFYGSNLRTGELEGVLDFYVLLAGEPESGIWPRVSYREWQHEGRDLRAKVATMTLAKFSQAASGETLDTTIWARFAQPCALVWQADNAAANGVHRAIGNAIQTAARLAAVLGPPSGEEDDFWMALFRATYSAEFRIEKPGRAQSILDLNRAHFDGLLPVALEASGMKIQRGAEIITPEIDARQRKRVKRWWARRRRLGKPLNLLRLVRASFTFEGAARYAAWKVERHTGVSVAVTPWRERHPVLAAPGVLFSVWRGKRKAR